ncbi:hypothetical protein LJC57_00385 [Parabacteroides sp. OttesenSCG-928-G07]|nr:hypothetical protein [Parabacteroides sp. OttesenSCG-928-G07]
MTPLELLKSEQSRLKRESKLMEKELAADFQYIHENAGSLLISTVSSLFFSHSKAGRKNASAAEKPTGGPSESIVSSLANPELLSIAGGVLPLVWSVVQPIVLAWGMKRVKNIFSHLFRKKRV